MTASEHHAMTDACVVCKRAELEAEIDRLLAAREMMQLDAEKYRDEASKLRADNERLRGHKEEADRHIATIAELRAEIARLTALKTPASAQLLNITKGCLDNAEAEIERLKAEVVLFTELQRASNQEIERLRTDRNDWKALAIQWAKDNEPLKDTNP